MRVSSDETLADLLWERIRRTGPIPFRDWMEAALYDERQGYYAREDLIRWGRAGDYRTSAERSTLFAATFARYFVQLFQKLGSPAQFTIIELGAGAGDFAAQVLDTLHQEFPNVFERTVYIVDEISGDARARIAERVAQHKKHVTFMRLADVHTIEAGVTFSNELLDAFPVHQITVQNGELREVYVDAGEHQQFRFAYGPFSTPRLLAHLKRFRIQPREGQLIEINLAAEDWLRAMASKLNRGFVVTVDYGAESAELYDSNLRSAGTLRAFRRHRFSPDVLSCPGDQDITSTINWTLVREVGTEFGLQVCEFQQLDRFLLKCGLLDELEHQCEAVTQETEKVRLRTAAREMILPGGMAGSFQVLVQGKGIE